MANPQSKAALDRLMQTKNDPTKFQQALTEAKSSGLDQATLTKLQQAKDDPAQIEQILTEAGH
jgi:hypothetical protein